MLTRACFTTLAAGFCIAQLGLNDSPPELSSTTMSRPAKMMNRHGALVSVLLSTVTNCARYRRQRWLPSPSYAMRLHYAGLLLLQKARSFGLVTCFRKRQLLLLGSTRCCS